jgi:hypothetical protein
VRRFIERDFLVAPQEQRVEHQRDVEQFRREPHEVDGHDRCAKEDEGVGRGGSARTATSREEQVGDEEIDAEQQGVEDQKTGRSEQPDERGRDGRIDKGLRVVQPRADGIITLDPAHVRKVTRTSNPVDLAAFQEDSFRAARKLLPYSYEILALVGEIEVVRETPRQ